MKIHEYQAKQSLKQYGVPVPAGQVASSFDKMERASAVMLSPEEIPNA